MAGVEVAIEVLSLRDRIDNLWRNWEDPSRKYKRLREDFRKNFLDLKHLVHRIFPSEDISKLIQLKRQHNDTEIQLRIGIGFKDKRRESFLKKLKESASDILEILQDLERLLQPDKTEASNPVSDPLQSIRCCIKGCWRKAVIRDRVKKLTLSVKCFTDFINLSGGHISFTEPQPQLSRPGDAPFTLERTWISKRQMCRVWLLGEVTSRISNCNNCYRHDLLLYLCSKLQPPDKRLSEMEYIRLLVCNTSIAQQEPEEECCSLLEFNLSEDILHHFPIVNELTNGIRESPNSLVSQNRKPCTRNSILSLDERLIAQERNIPTNLSGNNPSSNNHSGLEQFPAHESFDDQLSDTQFPGDKSGDVYNLNGQNSLLEYRNDSPMQQSCPEIRNLTLPLPMPHSNGITNWESFNDDPISLIQSRTGSFKTLNSVETNSYGRKSVDMVSIFTDLGRLDRIKLAREFMINFYAVNNTELGRLRLEDNNDIIAIRLCKENQEEEDGENNESEEWGLFIASNFDTTPAFSEISQLGQIANLNNKIRNPAMWKVTLMLVESAFKKSIGDINVNGTTSADKVCILIDDKNKKGLLGKVGKHYRKAVELCWLHSISESRDDRQFKSDMEKVITLIDRTIEHYSID